MELQAQTDFFSEVHKAGDQEQLEGWEKLHVPAILAPESVKAGQPFEVCISVGIDGSHPNENVHFIEFIELYVGQVYMARMDFTATATLPVFKAQVVLQKNIGPLRAFARCNVHGVWESQKPVRVQ